MGLRKTLKLDYLFQRVWEDLPSLLMIAILLLIASSSLAVAAWVDQMWILPLLAMLSLGLSYLLSISRFRDLTTLIFAIIYGLWFVTVMLGNHFLPESFTLAMRLQEVGYRARIWVEEAAQGGFSRDNMIFVLLLAIVFWMMAYNAAGNLFRTRRLWFAVIPPGLALLVNTYYYYGNARMDLFLIAYLFVTFALAVRMNAVLREKLWRSQRVGYTPGIRFDLLRAGVLAAVLVLALAWSAPAASASNRLSSAWDRSSNPWHSVKDTWQRLFGGVEGGTATAADYYGGATLSLGGPINLGNQTVMYVYAPEGHHYYWRSKLFDEYGSDGRWRTNSEANAISDFGILGSEESASYALRRTVQQRFELAIPASRLIYAAPQPVSFASLPINYEVIYTQEGSKDFATVTVTRSQEILNSGDSYSATSSVSIADAASLRLAGTDYPEWVTDSYLQLPGSITDRTKALAAEVASQYDNPYDTARGVEAYLRANMTYNESVDPVPQGEEHVDYFLFESQEGYCNYYAGAMTVMLRSQGIPARVAAGFVQGERDPDLGAFRVAESDAHTWVEVYFPGYGWLEFEPTASRSEIVRPESSPESLGGAIDPREQQPDGGELDPNEQLPDGGDFGEDEVVIPPTLMERILAWRPPKWMGWVAVALVIGLIGLVAVWYWIEQRGLGGLSDVSRSYARLNIYAPIVGVRLDQSATPYERANQIGWHVPDGRGEISQITGLYVDEQYAPEPEIPMEADRANAVAREAWAKLRSALVKATVVGRLQRLNPFRDSDITMK